MTPQPTVKVVINASASALQCTSVQMLCGVLLIKKGLVDFWATAMRLQSVTNEWAALMQHTLMHDILHLMEYSTVQRK